MQEQGGSEQNQGDPIRGDPNLQPMESDEGQTPYIARPSAPRQIPYPPPGHPPVGGPYQQPPGLSPPGSAERMTRFTVHPVLSLVMLLLLVGAGVMAYASTQPDPRREFGEFSSVSCALAGVALLIVLPTWLAYSVSRNRLAVNLTFGCMCAVVAGGMSLLFFGKLVEGRGRNQIKAADQAYRAIDDQQDRSTSLLERSVAGEDVSDEQAASAKKLADTLEQASKNAKDHEAVVFAALSKTMRHVQISVGKYNEAMNAMIACHGIDASSIKSREEIAQRIRIIQKAEVENEAFLQAVRGAPAVLAKELAKSKVPRAKITFLVGKYKEGAQMGTIQAIRATDTTILSESIRLLRLLDKHWGEWRVEEEEIFFDEDEVSTRYSDILDRIDKAATEQQALQQKVLEDKKRKAKERKAEKRQ